MGVGRGGGAGPGPRGSEMRWEDIPGERWRGLETGRQNPFRAKRGVGKLL